MDYQDAAAIRKKSFGTLLAEQEGGLGRSIGAAISQKTKAKITGIKETFDPLNIAKKLTFGSNLAPALLGKLFGANQKRIDYFSGVKNRNKSISNLESTSGFDSETMSKATECLGYIYKSLKQSIDDRRMHEELKKNRQEQEDSEEEIRNQEIIKAITGRKIKKERPRDEKGRFVKQEPKEPPKTTVKTETPAVFRPSAARVTPTTTVAGTTAVAAGGAAIVAAGVAGTLSISKAIAQGESARGSYDAANKGTKQGKIIGITQPVKLQEMTVQEIMRRQAIQWGAPNESDKLFAVGKYQMIPTTLQAAVKALNIDVSQKFDSRLQEKLFEEYLIGAKNPAIARYLNSPIDDPKLLYGALKSLSNEWASIADPDIPGGKTSHYGSGNKASITVEQMATLLKQDRETLQKRNLSNPPPAPETVITGTKMDSISKENKDLKTTETTQSSSSVNNNVNIQKSQQQTTTGVAVDDTNNYLKKVRE